jgi:hypothetical protein
VQWVIDWAFLESPGAPALRSTESIGVEIPTTFVGGSDRHHRLESNETTTKDPRASLARVPTDAGGQHMLLGLHFYEDASPNQERRRAAGGELVTPRSGPSRNVRVLATGWRTAPAGPQERVGDPGGIINQPAGGRVQMRRRG